MEWHSRKRYGELCFTSTIYSILIIQISHIKLSLPRDGTSYLVLIIHIDHAKSYLSRDERERMRFLIIHCVFSGWTDKQRSNTVVAVKFFHPGLTATTSGHLMNLFIGACYTIYGDGKLYNEVRAVIYDEVRKTRALCQLESDHRCSNVIRVPMKKLTKYRYETRTFSDENNHGCCCFSAAIYCVSSSKFVL